MIESGLMRHFVAVAQLGSFSAAAAKLGTGQSVVSRNIKRLEDQIGARLFERSTRHVKVTPAGAAFLEDAAQILDRIAVASDNARRIANGFAAEIRLAICPTLETPEIARGIAAFRQHWPGVELNLISLLSDLQPDAIRASAIDLGIMVSGESTYNALDWKVLGRYPIGVMVPSLWNLPQSAVKLTDLADRPIILPDRATAGPWHDGILDMCKRAGFQPRICNVVKDPMIARIMIACGMGATFVQDKGQHGSQDGMDILPLAGEPTYLPGEFVVAWSEHASSPQLTALVDDLINAWTAIA